MNPKLKDSIQEAQSLLSFAARSGINVDIGIVSAIVSTAAKLESGSITEQEETSFWMSFDALAKALAPVTVTSILATMDSNVTTTRRVFGIPLPRWSPARWAVFQYTMLAYFALVFLIPIQIYWLVGVVITSDIQTTETAVTQLQAANAATNTAAQDEELEHKQFQIESGYKMLGIWSGYWEATSENLESNCKSVDASKNGLCVKTSKEKSASVVLRILQQYFLPMLYGLLGATVYILRTLSYQIRIRSYSNASDIDFRIRLFLGTLGGLVSAWFLTPDVANGILKSLSPFAIAFLAGYSVELLFAAMDRIISTMTQAGK